MLTCGGRTQARSVDINLEGAVYTHFQVFLLLSDGNQQCSVLLVLP